MPSRVKLLNAAAPGTTGTPFKVGMGQPPYTIRTQGGYTNGSSTAGTNGVNIETSEDLVPAQPFPTAAEIAAATWARVMGIVGGPNETEQTTLETVDLHNLDTVVLQFYTRWVRAIAGSNMTGSATVYFEMGR